jgi:hypothetical protein
MPSGSGLNHLGEERDRSLKETSQVRGRKKEPAIFLQKPMPPERKGMVEARGGMMIQSCHSPWPA